jgi:signal transduction histidine kinase
LRKQEKAKGKDAFLEEQGPGTTKTVQTVNLIGDSLESAKEDLELDEDSKKSLSVYSALKELNVGYKMRSEQRYDSSAQQELAEGEAFTDEAASESPLKEDLIGQVAQQDKAQTPVWEEPTEAMARDRLVEAKSAAPAVREAREAREKNAPRQPAAKPALARAYAAAPLPRRKRFEPLTDKSNLGPSPMASALVDGRHLLLYRTSLREGASVVQQGLLVDLPALANWLKERVLGQGDLAEFIELDFGTLDASSDDAFASSSLEQKRFIYQHRFGEPFEELTARLSLAPLPDGGGMAYIYSIAALLMVVATFGLWAVYRMVAVAVHFAERRSNFAAAVSHELKTPLTAIRMYGEMLRDGMVANEAKRDEYYSTITTEAERLTRLINNVLEFSKMEHGERELDMISGSMGSVIEDVTRILATHAKDQGFELTCQVEKNLPPVQYERDALAQILFNLVDNALKYAAEASEKVVEVHCQSRRGGVDVRVRDFGPGVSREHRSHIFEAFYRGETELTRKCKGTGIGLALVKGLAEKMGARVSAENCDQGGFSVSVHFPTER